MNKYILISLLLTGCGAYVTSDDIANAEKVCENNGGLKHIYAYSNMTDKALCNNTARFYLLDDAE